MNGFKGFTEAFFNVAVAREYLPNVLQGAKVTIFLGLLVIVTGLSVGLVLAMLRTARSRPLNVAIIVFADAMRALPPLVIIILLFFALPYVGVSMSALAATWIALSMVLAAFAEEIFWAGLNAVDKGQTEAGRSVGLGAFKTLFYIVLPQALRITVAPITNRVVAIIKGTALGSVVALPEILSQASSASSLSANATPLTLAACAYLVLFVPVVFLGRWIETRFKWKK